MDFKSQKGCKIMRNFISNDASTISNPNEDKKINGNQPFDL